ncbi:MAG: hypothetical protein GY721_13625 [Deltaproteobacteria bacterium]|nr:hypothetical protein [Deltaproteobacteria bacterium]
MLVFGDASAPYIFQYMMQSLARHLSAKGWRDFIRYLDDVGVPLAFTLHESINQVTRFRRTMTDLGWVVSVKKSPDPAQALEFLGFLLDTVSQTLALSQARKEKIAAWVTKYLHQDLVTSRELLRVCGYMASALPVVPQALRWAGPVYALTTRPYTQRVRLTPLARQAIQSFTTVAMSAARRVMGPRTVDYSVIGDAVPTKVGALLYRGIPPYAAPTSGLSEVVDTAQSEMLDERLITIAHKELWTVVWAVTCWVRILTGKSIAIFTDNKNTESAIKKGWSRDPLMAQLAEELWEVLDEHAISVETVYWLPSEYNWEADYLSREGPDRTNDWALTEFYLEEFLERFVSRKGLPGARNRESWVDCFASRLNRRFQRYCSLHRDLDSLGDFFWFQPKEGDVLWCNPPFYLIGDVLARLKALGCPAYLLVPVWTTRPWWTSVSAMRHWEVRYRDQHMAFAPRVLPKTYTLPTWRTRIVCVNM